MKYNITEFSQTTVKGIHAAHQMVTTMCDSGWFAFTDIDGCNHLVRIANIDRISEETAGFDQVKKCVLFMRCGERINLYAPQESVEELRERLFNKIGPIQMDEDEEAEDAYDDDDE